MQLGKLLTKRSNDNHPNAHIICMSCQWNLNMVLVWSNRKLHFWAYVFGQGTVKADWLKIVDVFFVSKHDLEQQLERNHKFFDKKSAHSWRWQRNKKIQKKLDWWSAETLFKAVQFQGRDNSQPGRKLFVKLQQLDQQWNSEEVWRDEGHKNYLLL